MEGEDIYLEEYHEDESGGFDVNSFIGDVPDDFKCPVCLSVMKEPVQTSCGHQFCKGCLLHSTFRESDDSGSEEGNGQLKCPRDRKLLPENGGYFPDKALERKILSMKAHCNYREYGCHWEDELRYFEDHLSECGNRIVQCDCCTKKIRLRLKKKHELECPYFVVDCPQKCGVEKMYREEVESHLKDDCRVTMIFCPFKDVGCSFHDQRMNLMDHCERSISDHLIKTQKGLQDTKEELEEAQEENKELRLQNLDLRKRVNELYCSMSTLRGEVKDLLKANTDKIEESETEIVSVNERLDKFESHNEDKMQQFQTEIASLKTSLKREVQNQVGRIEIENGTFQIKLNQMEESFEKKMGGLQRVLDFFKKRLHQEQLMKGQIDDLTIEKVSLREEANENKSLLLSLQRSVRSLGERLNQYERSMSSGSNENRDLTSFARKEKTQSALFSRGEGFRLPKKRPHVGQVRATNDGELRNPLQSLELPHDAAVKKKRMESSEQLNMKFVAKST